MRKVFSLVSVAILLAVSVPLVGAQTTRTALHVDLTPTMYATDAGLGSVTGSAHVQPEDGYLTITLQPNGTELPAGTVLEGWLVDAGLAGGMDMAATDDMMATPDEMMATPDDMMATPDEMMATPDDMMATPDDMMDTSGDMTDSGMTDTGMSGSNASAADEMYGTPFGDASFNELVSSAPYALSTGVLAVAEDGTWALSFQVPGYNFSPYDAVVVTLESDADCHGRLRSAPRHAGLHG